MLNLETLLLLPMVTVEWRGKLLLTIKKESIQNLNTHRYLKNQTAAATKEYIEIYARFNSKYDFPRTNSIFFKYILIKYRLQIVKLTKNESQMSSFDLEESFEEVQYIVIFQQHCPTHC